VNLFGIGWKKGFEGTKWSLGIGIAWKK